MSVNGITGSPQPYSSYTASKTKENTTKTTENAAASTSETVSDGAVYEQSSKTEKPAAAKVNTPKQNAAIVAQLKADSDARANQLKQLVEQMIGKQGNAYGQATDMWKFLASGNYTVDAATKAQAQADIAEDGYWGVEKTSDRILDFAKALSGGDADKMTEMVDAFKKGFEQATKTWGGQLPDISQRTYDAVLKKFDTWQQENAAAVTE